MYATVQKWYPGFNYRVHIRDQESNSSSTCQCVTLNNVGEVLLNSGKIVDLGSECKDCLVILSSEQEIPQSVVFFGALEYWSMPMGR